MSISTLFVVQFFLISLIAQPSLHAQEDFDYGGDPSNWESQSLQEDEPTKANPLIIAQIVLFDLDLLPGARKFVEHVEDVVSDTARYLHLKGEYGQVGPETTGSGLFGLTPGKDEKKSVTNSATNKEKKFLIPFIHKVQWDTSFDANDPAVRLDLNINDYLNIEAQAGEVSSIKLLYKVEFNLSALTPSVQQQQQQQVAEKGSPEDKKGEGSNGGRRQMPVLVA
ncbi:MAG: hypothetical protein ABFR97_00280 [Thermodesulfobacteriota bacterium]